MCVASAALRRSDTQLMAEQLLEMRTPRGVSSEVGWLGKEIVWDL